MKELRVNLHLHSKLSRNNCGFYQIAQAALKNRVDAFITTDCNVRPTGQEQYYYQNEKRTLCLCGEEIYESANEKQDHILLYGIDREMSGGVYGNQQLISGVSRSGTVSVIAHPFDAIAPLKDKSLFGYSGLELFNLDSEIYERTNQGGILLFNDRSAVPIGANAQTTALWDELLTRNLHVNAYAGSHHFLPNHSSSPEFCMAMLNNHIWTNEEMNGDINHDSEIIIEALRVGRFFIANDGIADAEGFSFTAHGEHAIAYPGESISLGYGITLKIKSPVSTLCRIIHNNKVLKQWDNITGIPYTISEPGYYRLECYLPYKHELRGWIYTNPIYAVRG